jgi:hypothetical protein
MNGVSRLYLQAYLDEYCWRLVNGNRNGWSVYTAIIKAIRDYFNLFQNPNDILDQTIQEENHIVNNSIDANLDFGNYGNENPEPLTPGNIENLRVPLNMSSQIVIRQAFSVERSPSPSSAAASTSNAAASTSNAAASTSNAAASIGRIGSLNGFNNSSPEYHSSPIHFQTQTQAGVLPKVPTLSSRQPPSSLVNYSVSESSELNDISEINHEPPIDSGQIRQFSSNNNDQSDEEPSSKRARFSNTSRLLNVTFTVGPATSPSAQVDFTSQYRLILEEFINGTDQQFACPPTLTKEQREIVHQLADELNLKHESKGNWRRRILFVYKTEFINPNLI